MSEHESKHEISEELGYETQEILRRTPAIIFSASLVILVVVTILLTLWILNTEENRRQPSVNPSPLAGTQELTMRAAELQADPNLEMREYLEQEKHLESSFGWIDKNAGVVRLPIDVAMEIALERGFPVRKKSVDLQEEFTSSVPETAIETEHGGIGNESD